MVWISMQDRMTVIYTTMKVECLGMLMRPGVPPVTPGRLMMSTRMISPKPRVTMAR